jgi:chromosome segregation ATPase
MSSHTHSSLGATENDLRREFKSLLDKRTREYAHELAVQERAIAALERDFRSSDRDTAKRIKGLEDILKGCFKELEDTVGKAFVGRNKKIDEIESKVRKLEREVREKEKSVEDLLRMNSDKENRIRVLERR